MKKIAFIVEKTATGFSAYAEDFEQTPVGTTGKDMATLKKNITEALHLYRGHKGLKPVPDKDIVILLDLQQFFEYYKEINAKSLSERIGMNQTLLSQYVNGIKKPSVKQVKKILAGVKALGQELTQLEFA
ncbi:helix-turn-helix domain-containing protein [Chitinophaga japonensis]|uniref:Helix-turn-helix protein n=1 Tax=Chitinophaga japonensis TaxID=104662 RepID=A0A562TAP7_CHIJA|nr:helix-turn-helix transcriptional regulator [Chitinophaga japonensis]TWI90699.1 helix-turn-helix protein [Chitinophaga japonensis]